MLNMFKHRSQTPELICALENHEAYKKIITLMLAPTILFDLTASLSLDRFKGQELEVCVRIDRSCDSQNMIVYMHMMPSARYMIFFFLNPIESF